MSFEQNTNVTYSLNLQYVRGTRLLGDFDDNDTRMNTFTTLSVLEMFSYKELLSPHKTLEHVYHDQIGKDKPGIPCI